MRFRDALIAGLVAANLSSGSASATDPAAIATRQISPDKEYSVAFPCAEIEVRHKGGAEWMTCSTRGIVFISARGFPSRGDSTRPATYADLLGDAHDSFEGVTETRVGGHSAFKVLVHTDEVMVCMAGVDLPKSPLLLTAGEVHPSPIPANERSDWVPLLQEFCDSAEVPVLGSGQ